ncbi:hypothetical protein Poli38472_014005 [Pythium oligandrum]|uniref:Uncharacterized protein n=1 Tax=Pythium oligandrum TaxID=41045 RepID=A0A8K1CPL4_PYTOL|nr:hypothetical protein Poli38472_014005 [Pythium oligandrum]|eukprot:TMW66693.1 hypothetical protein Poli38472_014005 [Pythium oligandrum]
MRPMLSPIAVATAAMTVVGIKLSMMAIAAPNWVVGETRHLTSSATFYMDVRAGIWGYCRTATIDPNAGWSSTEFFQNCFTFHSPTKTQKLSVCEAYQRGFVYGTDDVRGIRLPVGDDDDVHRIPRPPSSLDDEYIKRFIEKSCGRPGVVTTVSATTGLVAAVFAIVSFLWSHVMQRHANRCELATTHALLPAAATMSLASVFSWLYQSSDLLDPGHIMAPFQLGSWVYCQLIAAVLFTVASISVRHQIHRHKEVEIYTPDTAHIAQKA